MTGELDANFVQTVAAALNLQMARDAAQFWQIAATVEFLPEPLEIPSGIWPIQLVGKLPPGAGGYHLDQHNQPYAKVLATRGDDSWTIDASHELIEMLVDPHGNRIRLSKEIEIHNDEIKHGSGMMNYLVEACDPCQSFDHAYEIGGVLVSDFITPHYYDPGPMYGRRYSFTGAVTSPRQVLPGGYISFVNPISDEWEQISWTNNDGPPTIRRLGSVPEGTRSLREWIDIKSPSSRDFGTEIKRRIQTLGRRREMLRDVARRRGSFFKQPER